MLSGAYVVHRETQLARERCAATRMTGGCFSNTPLVVRVGAVGRGHNTISELNTAKRKWGEQQREFSVHVVTGEGG